MCFREDEDHIHSEVKIIMFFDTHTVWCVLYLRPTTNLLNRGTDQSALTYPFDPLADRALIDLFAKDGILRISVYIDIGTVGICKLMHAIEINVVRKKKDWEFGVGSRKQENDSFSEGFYSYGQIPNL